MKKYQSPPSSAYQNPAPKQTLPANYDSTYPKENPSYTSSSNIFTNREEPKKAATYSHEYQPYVKPEPETAPIKQSDSYDTYKPYYSTSHPPQYQSTSYQYPENPATNDNHAQYYTIPAAKNVFSLKPETNFQEQPKQEDSFRPTYEPSVIDKISDFLFEKPVKKNETALRKDSENLSIKNRKQSPDFNTNLGDFEVKKNGTPCKKTSFKI